ncbi:MAG: hypothetical protein PHX64_01480 [Candidatus Omnitrophica bacterium]|nr:hypothetical protein [Candidatus Omnitrophota bacterium]MDD5310410.1 hypothetical protein [Candidatus Omnitrophota bacterium]MDD5546746.1 hypothetical protein [Candidatus Omnitrophota bacterium]
MKISKTQIAIILSLCVLAIIIILSLGRPQPKPAVTAAPEAKPEEQIPLQAGKYELPPAQENAGYPVSQSVSTPSAKPVPSIPPTSPAPAASIENTRNPDNSLSGGTGNAPKVYEPSPDLPKKPPKMPPPEVLQKMQRQGIVAY